MVRPLVILLSFLLLASGCSCPCKTETPGFRIVSTAPNVTEILFALGLDDNIVGVSQHCNYPPAARSKTKIGTFSRPNIERIAGLKPDIAFTTGLEQDAISEGLGKLGIKTFKVYPGTLDELYQATTDIGGLTGKENQAVALVTLMKKAIGEVQEKASGIPPESKKTFLLEIIDNPLMVAGKDSFAGALGAIAGGVNIAHDTERAYSKFSPELVIERDPDCIILGYMFRKKGALDIVKKRVGWSKIKAVSDGAVFNDIDPDVLLRPGPRTPQAVRELYERLYER